MRKKKASIKKKFLEIIKQNAIPILASLTIIFLLFFTAGILTTNFSNWKTKEIIYSNITHEVLSGKGGTSSYYLIHDSHERTYKIRWENKLENSGFMNNVKIGDKLIIQYQTWFFSDYIETLKTNDKIYRSEYEAKEFCKSEQKEFLLISFVILFLIFIFSIFFTKSIIKYKKAKKELIIENEKYNNQQDKLSNWRLIAFI